MKAARVAGITIMTYSFKKDRWFRKAMVTARGISAN
jgi:hypothetical protein